MAALTSPRAARFTEVHRTKPFRMEGHRLARFSLSGRAWRARAERIFSLAPREPLMGQPRRFLPMAIVPRGCPTLLHPSSFTVRPIRSFRWREEDTGGGHSRAEPLVIEGMGHDVPRDTWPQIIPAISKLTAGALAAFGSSASAPALPGVGAPPFPPATAASRRCCRDPLGPGGCRGAVNSLRRARGHPQSDTWPFPGGTSKLESRLRGRDSRDGGRGRASSNPAQHASWAPALLQPRPGLAWDMAICPSFLRPQRRFRSRGPTSVVGAHWAPLAPMFSGENRTTLRYYTGSFRAGTSGAGWWGAHLTVCSGRSSP